MAQETDTTQSVPPSEHDASPEAAVSSPAAQPLTGFKPQDKHRLAPDRVPSALETFRPPSISEPAVEADPIAATSEKERREHRKEVDGIVKAQRDAETLVGISLRR
jgi:hypothetical protein